HPDFRGSTSIKAVLPVLCPELSYEGLAIREGATASEQWWEMVSGAGAPEKRREIADALRAYCKLDTFAMYAIWRVLQAASVPEIENQKGGAGVLSADCTEKYTV